MSSSVAPLGSYKHLEQRVSLALIKRGWRGCDGTAIAIKEHTTAVGPREAHAYLIDCLASEKSVVLTGQYWSEGRNIIESIFVAIPAYSSAVEVDALVSGYIAKVTEAVDHSYAGNLYRLGVRAA